MTEPKPEKDYLTSQQVASILRVSPVTVRQWANNCGLKALTTQGGHRRFLKTDVEMFAKQNGMMIGPDKKRILVVDDEVSIANFIKEAFETRSGDFQVELVHDGFMAGSFIQTFQPHIIFMDIMMPDINGIEVCRFLKSNEESKHITIIAMTGYPSEENVGQMLAAGAKLCLKKPLTIAQLMEAVQLSDSRSET